MKDGRFSSQREIYQALLDGKKLRYEAWEGYQYICLAGPLIVDQYHSKASYGFEEPSQWELYTEPKKMKTVWEWLCQLKGGVSSVCGVLYTEEQAQLAFPPERYTLTKLRSFEVEDV